MTSFVEEVAATPGGEDIWACIQCGICTGSCPSANEWEYSIRKIIAMIRADMREEVLSSSSAWHCLSCYTCTTRCPRNVEPTHIGHALKSLAIKHGYNIKGTRTPAFYQSFVDSLKANGRIHEVGIMSKFYMRTNPLAAMKLLPMTEHRS